MGLRHLFIGLPAGVSAGEVSRPGKAPRVSEPSLVFAVDTV
jgi:hypothetical protein